MTPFQHFKMTPFQLLRWRHFMTTKFTKKNINKAQLQSKHEQRNVELLRWQHFNMTKCLTLEATQFQNFKVANTSTFQVDKTVAFIYDQNINISSWYKTLDKWVGTDSHFQVNKHVRFKLTQSTQVPKYPNNSKQVTNHKSSQCPAFPVEKRRRNNWE